MKALAIILTVSLLGLMTWLMLDARSKATGAMNQMELMRKQQRGEAEPVATASALPTSVSDLEAAVQESKLLSQQVAQGNMPPPIPGAGTGLPARPAVDPAITAAPPALTPRQRQVQAAPAIGNVIEYKKEYGFVVIGAGSSRALEAGMTFAVRRGNAIIARIKVTSVENSSAIADIEASSVPPGVTLQVGDDVIQDLPPG
jgi:hypothetical protein